MTKAKSHTHLYAAYKSSPMWKVVSKAIAELVKNGDLLETTGRPHVVGYICKRISEAKPPKAKSQ